MGLDSIYWTIVASSLALNDRETTWATRDRDGLWSPPFTLNSTEYPLQAGSVFNYVKTGERIISLKVELRSDSHQALLEKLREFTYLLNPGLGEGALSIDTDGGYSRFLRCRCSGLVKVAEREKTASLLLSFVANDPYWYDGTQLNATFVQGDGAAFFPIFPIRLVASASFAEDNLVNIGDVETWPIWTITGPATDIVIENQSTGKKIDLTGLTVAEYDWLVIDTRPGAKSVLMDGREGIVTDVREYLSLDSSLFPLALGANSLIMRINSPGTGTQISLDYYLRYLSP